MPIARYAVTALLALAALLGVILLVRPLIFSLAPPLNDANYRLMATGDADAGPQLVPLVLNDSHGLPGERVSGERAGVTVVVAPIEGTGRYTVVDAWSPTNECPIELGADRLIDWRGRRLDIRRHPDRSGRPSARELPDDHRQWGAGGRLHASDRPPDIVGWVPCPKASTRSRGSSSASSPV